MSAGWTYGAEHELADIHRRGQLPPGYGWDVKDFTIVNSNGIANDPKGEFYHFGGEVNTPPTETLEGQVMCLVRIKQLFPEAKVNYRSNLHVHIRVPGLKEDLDALKRVQRFIHDHMAQVLPVIEPLTAPQRVAFPDYAQWKGAVRRYRRRCVSHQTVLPPARLARQLKASSIKEFFNWEPPQSKAGKPMWHAQPRLCVSLRQLLQTDTVEFRHFPGTLDQDLLWNCLGWCHRFMSAALNDGSIHPLLHWAKSRDWPPFPPYVHWQEVRYRATCHDGTLTKARIKANIQAILEDRFDAGAGSVPREHKSKPAVRRPPGEGLLS